MQQIKKDVTHKLHFLVDQSDALNFQAFYQKIKNETKKKKSLEIWFEKYYEIDPNIIDFNEEINWKEYIDEYDLEEFTSHIKKIPKVSEKSSSNQLSVIRNKLIYRDLLQYALSRVGTSITCCFGGYRVMQDLFYNVTVYDSCPYEKVTTVNGYQKKPHGHYRIPISDSLLINTIDLSTYNNFYATKTKERNHVIDLSDLP